MACRLCLGDRIQKITGSGKREFHLCQHCKLITISPQHFLSPDEEKKRYLTHKNGIQYQGYVDFLNRAVRPALKFITKPMCGLDYGCGHAPTLSKILKMQGYQCEDYDPYFVPHDLDKKYDFIFSTEVFEHFRSPRRDIKKIVDLLQPGGILIIMTERWKTIDTFPNWYYHHDPSHVAFYHNETIDYICGAFRLKKIFEDNSRITVAQM